MKYKIKLKIRYMIPPDIDLEGEYIDIHEGEDELEAISTLIQQVKEKFRKEGLHITVFFKDIEKI